MRFTRRAALASALACVAGPARAQTASTPIGAILPPWTPGTLDVHVVATARGDATLVVGPSGDTLLIDVGAAQGDPAHMLTPRGYDGADPGAFVAAYVLRVLKQTGRAGLDALLLTHLHDDHVSGVASFAARVPIGLLVDPDFPDYGYPPFEGRRAIEAYVAFAARRAAEGERTEKLIAGRSDQIVLPGVEIRALASRGQIWTGKGNETRSIFPARETLSPADYPNENAAGSALRLRFGAFSAFLGSDLTDWADAGARPWMDALTPAAEACGPVDFALAPHHALYDASGPAFVQALRPQIWAASIWHETHASPSSLARFTNERLNSRFRAMYLTDISNAAATMSPRSAAKIVRRGHIVVRVLQGGSAFAVYAIDPTDPSAPRISQASERLAATGS